MREPRRRRGRESGIATTIAAVFMLVSLAAADFAENQLIGTPEILCNAETIEMQFKTRQPFGGKVYVKGHYSRPECRVDYGERTPDGHPKGGIRLNHGACDMDRQRTITPDGMMFSTVLVISFHPLFVTKVDRAFNIKCMYKEAERMLTQQLDVSALPTETIAYDMPMPTCSYTIRRDQLDGPILRYARVGDQVVHRWECESDMYGVLVHTCYVEDGQGERQMIIDDKGCHTDHTLLGDPTYVEALNMAYRESYVFKFADRTAVRFQCEIRLCLKDEGGCDGVTPPICFDSSHNRINQNLTLLRRRRRNSEGGPLSHLKDADLISQTVYVMDKEEMPTGNGEQREMTNAATIGLSSGSLCMSPLQVLCFVSAMAVLILLLVSALTYVLCNKYYKITTAEREMYMKP